MSRSVKGSKGPGYEYWGRRPGIKFGSPGKEAKKLTHRLERRRAQEALQRTGDDAVTKRRP